MSPNSSGEDSNSDELSMLRPDGPYDDDLEPLTASPEPVAGNSPPLNGENGHHEQFRSWENSQVNGTNGVLGQAQTAGLPYINGTNGLSERTPERELPLNLGTNGTYDLPRRQNIFGFNESNGHFEERPWESLQSNGTSGIHEQPRTTDSAQVNGTNSYHQHPRTWDSIGSNGPNGLSEQPQVRESPRINGTSGSHELPQSQGLSQTNGTHEDQQPPRASIEPPQLNGMNALRQHPPGQLAPPLFDEIDYTNMDVRTIDQPESYSHAEFLALVMEFIGELHVRFTGVPESVRMGQPIPGRVELWSEDEPPGNRRLTVEFDCVLSSTTLRFERTEDTFSLPEDASVTIDSLPIQACPQFLGETTCHVVVAIGVPNLYLRPLIAYYRSHDITLTI